MLDGLTGEDVLGLLLATAAISFCLGRTTAKMRVGIMAETKRINRQSATDAFADFPQETQTEVDRLVAAGKTIDAVKAVRKASGLGLYEAKQIVDLRKSHLHPA